ncbi:hypothetical protein KAFR_0E00900 [Kazachstania africana CBS 2517]|uniref:Phosphatidylinositol N-acetylglucosaminyltransferase n=1 Tax=Kazachstania africana (strain ATCC 22294 / BCRC 22015 / CBS 2517 / CECT 1963 / NBRC 1671 / NRRL Y-8276) TaxID=1071382 RepID=H2AV44_KAZAF|nr:hypothetical protein KAFR_0E00900 [Kazachstania africana CBS 2517]CCF58244.1 hypothetical protein KAFR_0E00900 [Kazachstania africana CBS 2517]
MKEKEPWKRLLWIRQDYPDNYTDPNFLLYAEKLKEKSKRPPDFDYDYSQIRADFLELYHMVLNTCFIYITFTYINYYEYNPIPVTCIVTFFVILISNHKSEELASLLNFKSSMIMAFTILTLSPVLKSLSKTTASDSIWTLSFCLNMFYIYSLSSSPSSVMDGRGELIQNEKQSNLSTNILLANAAVLASRLISTTQVFCFLLISVQVNIIIPNLLNISNFKISLLTNLIVYSSITMRLGYKAAFIFLLISLASIIILPRLFYYWQVHCKRKDYEVLSLWDTKVPILN